MAFRQSEDREDDGIRDTHPRIRPRKAWKCSAARHLAAAAEKELLGEDEVHNWLLAAYSHRIDQAIRGDATPSLPNELMQRLENLERFDRYKIDRARQRSKIIGDSKVDPFRRYLQGRGQEGIALRISELNSIHEGDVLQVKLQQLRSDFPDEEIGVLAVELAAALRLDQAYGKKKLQELLKEDLEDIPLESSVGLIATGLELARHLNEQLAFEKLAEQLGAALEDNRNVSPSSLPVDVLVDAVHQGYGSQTVLDLLSKLERSLREAEADSVEPGEAYLEESIR